MKINTVSYAFQTQLKLRVDTFTHNAPDMILAAKIFSQCIHFLRWGVLLRHFSQMNFKRTLALIFCGVTFFCYNECIGTFGTFQTLSELSVQLRENELSGGTIKYVCSYCLLGTQYILASCLSVCMFSCISWIYSFAITFEFFFEALCLICIQHKHSTPFGKTTTFSS